MGREGGEIDQERVRGRGGWRGDEADGGVGREGGEIDQERVRGRGGDGGGDQADGGVGREGRLTKRE